MNHRFKTVGNDRNFNPDSNEEWDNHAGALQAKLHILSKIKKPL
jgi:hypothetical protein